MRRTPCAGASSRAARGGCLTSAACPHRTNVIMRASFSAAGRGRTFPAAADRRNAMATGKVGRVRCAVLTAATLWGSVVAVGKAQLPPTPVARAVPFTASAPFQAPGWNALPGPEPASSPVAWQPPAVNPAGPSLTLPALTVPTKPAQTPVVARGVSAQEAVSAGPSPQVCRLTLEEAKE